MLGSDKAVRRWVTAPQPAQPPEGGTAPPLVHPREELEGNVKFWTELWSGPPLDPENLTQFLRHLPPQVELPQSSCFVTGEELQKRAKESAGTSAGMDAWLPADLARLPLKWFEKVAALWNAIMADGLDLPTPWVHLRIALIDKEDGGQRPIGVAAAIWRICGAATVSHWREWIATWIHPNLAGGAAGRRLDDVLDALMGAMEKAVQTGEPMVGGSIDLSKCFDRVRIDQVLLVLRHLGAPQGALQCVEKFYANRQNHFTKGKLVSEEPATAATGLVQGCPFSVVSLNALMSVWAWTLSAEVPDLQFGCFLDDRTMWATGEDRIPMLSMAEQVALDFDTAIGAQWNEKKNFTFATFRQDDRALKQR